jgi:hypothetical protein
MTSDLSEDDDERELYFEQGASWWALLFGPCFALIGLGFELVTSGPVFISLWIAVAAALTVFTALWVHARRRFTLVRLTDAELRQGPETLEVARIAEVGDGEPPPGAKVLGGGLAAPRKYDEVPLRLDDDTIALAWARDGEALREALREAIGS